MKLRFKQQQYQTDAVQAVVDVFQGQSRNEPRYQIDPGQRHQSVLTLNSDLGFGNAPVELNDHELLTNIQQVQRRNRDLPLSKKLYKDEIAPIQLDVEMETGTGKTYVYIKTMFELFEHYGWRKFVIVVPSIAIREGVAKSITAMEDHFFEQYGQKIRHFIYNSNQLHQLESFASDAGINCMIINVQAFNSTGKDNRRIYECLDDFQSRRPIDVIAANHPILILDEPQKMEGKKTLDSLRAFQSPMILRYSATHKTEHNLVHRLDALDAYNQKLVKKIAVRGITVRGLGGTAGYLFLESIDISKVRAPMARVHIEQKLKDGTIKRVVRKLSKGDNLYDLSNGLTQYKGYVLSDVSANAQAIEFTNGARLDVGDATGDVTEETLREIQIREAIKAHFEKERQLYRQGIKVLTLFFIDEVAKYRDYDQEDAKGVYARFFEEEYERQRNELLSEIQFDEKFEQYLQRDTPQQVHEGYFAIDKKTNRSIDVDTYLRGARAGEPKDESAYDLILKNRERLLSHEEPVRFIFSHSALREGWDNPNIFVICALKHSDNTISRRQEVGRGLRISVNQHGERQDDPAIVHQTNVLTVVASESYKDFVAGLQDELRSELGTRPTKVSVTFFRNQFFATEDGQIPISKEQAESIDYYLKSNRYIDRQGRVTERYKEEKSQGKLAPIYLDLQPFENQIHDILERVITGEQLPMFVDERRTHVNTLNDNFHKKEFQALWAQINRKAAYQVSFNSTELIYDAIQLLNAQLQVPALRYTVERGEQRDEIDIVHVEKSDSFEWKENRTEAHKRSVRSKIALDLLGEIAAQTELTRRTVHAILTGIHPDTFGQYKQNPEAFISKASQLINQAKSTLIVQEITYDPIDDRYDESIFTAAQLRNEFSGSEPLQKHVFDYLESDSKTERTFAEHLEKSDEVVVYSKLPGGFKIPTPLGDYNPDWAISFHRDKVKHIYFVAETKGSMNTLELRGIEDGKINCAKVFFETITQKFAPENVKYKMVSSYRELQDEVMR